MKKLRLFFRNIPRKVKIAANLLLCLALAFWIYLLLGSPATAATHYRRAERANLVGPGNILAIEHHPGLGYENLVLAEDDDAVMLYVRDEEDSSRTQLVYRQRCQGMALLSLPAAGRNPQISEQLPIFLWDGYADAVRAELTLSLPDGTDASPVLNANRESDGFFRFHLVDKTGTLRELIHRLLLLSENTMSDTRSHTVTAKIRLYDSQDALLTENILTPGQ